MTRMTPEAANHPQNFQATPTYDTWLQIQRTPDKHTRLTFNVIWTLIHDSLISKKIIYRQAAKAFQFPWCTTMYETCSFPKNDNCSLIGIKSYSRDSVQATLSRS
ncbi:hypothetical protein AVEN_83188-1 [Araneus ventricosus]|uniref:Uncharacterized protein n=1 Tax=Araneus ventricosus TaxID=182803 RepID=A0A4Y2AMM2_ARAVE|nr:hypothetical protein AVEN_83188-1 [Araneus ventricosus]